MSAGKQFFRDLLDQKSPLLDAIVAFNRLLPARLDEHAVPPAHRPLLPFIRNTGGARHFFALLPSLVPGAPSDWATAFQIPRHRLALLPPPLLEQLALWYGLVLHRREIAAVIDRNSVLALRSAIGEDGYAFVLRRSALLAAGDPPAPASGLSLPQRIRQTGREAVSRVLADAHPSILARLSLTLPSDFLPVRPADASAWPLLRTLILKEIAPSWQACFI